VDSQDRQIGLEIEAELEEWLDKEAAARGIDREALQQSELEAWERWSKDPNQQDFETLYQSHQPLFETIGARYMKSSNLPTAAIRSRMTQNYVKALEGYDPTRGAKLSTHVMNTLPHHIPRYIQKYTNIGRIPDDMGGMIGLLEERNAALSDRLGRLPTNDELADDMLMSARDYSDQRKKLITPKKVGTLRRSLRLDFVAEEAGGVAPTHGVSKLEQHAVYLHGSLNSEQKLILEHTYEGFDKPIIQDVERLSRTVKMSPQKVRAIKKQIWKKMERYM